MKIEEKVDAILANHNLMHIATINKLGNPAVRGVDFVSGDTPGVLYFLTRKDSNKVSQIKVNANISIAIDHDCPSIKELMELYYLKATATAQIVENMDEMNTAMGLLMNKLSFLADLPGDKNDFVVIKIKLQEVAVTDNRESFGHTEILNYN